MAKRSSARDRVPVRWSLVSCEQGDIQEWSHIQVSNVEEHPEETLWKARARAMGKSVYACVVEILCLVIRRVDGVKIHLRGLTKLSLST